MKIWYSLQIESIFGKKHMVFAGKKLKVHENIFPPLISKLLKRGTAQVDDEYPQKYVFKRDTSKVHPMFNGFYSLQPGKQQLHIKKGDNKSRV